MPSELDVQFEAQRKEYSTYVATETIFYGGARAFNVGDPVPASSVDGDNGWVDKSQVKLASAPASASPASSTPSTTTSNTTPSGS
jgi:hypothetical protein